jgi:hypothetical protein
MRGGLVVVLVVALAGAACGNDPTATTSTTSSSAAATSVTSTSTTTSTTSSTTSAPSTTVPSGATSSSLPEPIDACDPAPVLAMAERAFAAARLEPGGGAWTTDVGAGVFTERTIASVDFADRLGLDCSLLVAQAGAVGTERLLLAAWTGSRTAYVIQATDAPSPPFAEEVRFDLLVYWVDGEFVGDDLWGGTLADGESLLIGTVDYSLGAVAKAWQVAFPEPPPAPVEIDAEEYAIEALETAGARNVGIAAPAEGDVASIAFMTPLGNVMIATVGPVGGLPPEPYLTGITTTETVADTQVTLALPGPDQFDVAQTVFTCGTYVWWLSSSWGTPEEIFDWTAELVEALGCA